MKMYKNNKQKKKKGSALSMLPADPPSYPIFPQVRIKAEAP